MCPPFAANSEREEEWFSFSGQIKAGPAEKGVTFLKLFRLSD